MDNRPVINCHTHIFTGDHVPPFIARSFVPWPFYFLLPLAAIVRFFRWWYKGPATIRYKVWYKKLQHLYTIIGSFINRLGIISTLAGYYIFLIAFFILYSFLPRPDPGDTGWPHKAADWLQTTLDPVLPNITATGWKLTVVIFVLLFLPSVRNMLLFIGKLFWKILSKIPGPQTKELFKRYLQIGRYAFHLEQKTILTQLRGQYQPGTGFVVLPMDMDYMGAGSGKTRYRDQMQELADIITTSSKRKTFLPFIFADPRRFVKPEEEDRTRPGDIEYFNWYVDKGKIKLGECFIKTYIESHGFRGIKIYPALGYYPFDDNLLPLWLYAAENNIPILTHCIRGTIFYRGIKKKEWNEHPVFMQSMGWGKKEDAVPIDGYDSDDTQSEKDERKTDYRPLLLPELKNMDFSINFTHPLNYLCLLEEKLLRKVVGNAFKNDAAKRKALHDLFGYTNAETPMDKNLNNLKVCMGHFGGDDEWRRYYQKDRYIYSNQLVSKPRGIEFFKKSDGSISEGKLENLWKFTDWYSIICSMMMQYPNVYADISYILHDDAEILPLLKETLKDDRLRSKVLYGTDFFVVRNHKSDKQMLADMRGGLEQDDFDCIAKENPRTYLQTTVHGPVPF